MRMSDVFKVFGLILLLTGCTGRGSLAPIEEVKWHPFSQSSYSVRRGDTLYAIAFRYDRDYRELARANHLRYPYSLRVGQRINIAGAGSGRRFYQWQSARRRPQSRHWNRPSQSSPAARPVYTQVRSIQMNSRGQWQWPLSGQVITGFAPESGNKGLDIAGRQGDKVHAAGGGVVAYAGNGLSGYGNLIIIKHNNQYLTAYGHNARNLVREGQRVRKGQAIAEIGQIDRRHWGVHFEFRRSGQPVNPLNFIQKG